MRGVIMFKRVVSFLDGRVVFYYNDKEVTYREDQEPEVIEKLYNKKGTYGFLGRATDIPNSSRSFGGH